MVLLSSNKYCRCRLKLSFQSKQCRGWLSMRKQAGASHNWQDCVLDLQHVLFPWSLRIFSLSPYGNKIDDRHRNRKSQVRNHTEQHLNSDLLPVLDFLLRLQPTWGFIKVSISRDEISSFHVTFTVFCMATDLAVP